MIPEHLAEEVQREFARIGRSVAVMMAELRDALQRCSEEVRELLAVIEKQQQQQAEDNRRRGWPADERPWRPQHDARERHRVSEWKASRRLRKRQKDTSRRANRRRS